MSTLFFILSLRRRCFRGIIKSVLEEGGGGKRQRQFREIYSIVLCLHAARGVENKKNIRRKCVLCKRARFLFLFSHIFSRSEQQLLF